LNLKAFVRLFRQTGPAADVLDLPLCYLLALNIGLRNDCHVAMRKDVA
jgi:hypothetical protein